jgi:hypothetical protein
LYCLKGEIVNEGSYESLKTKGINLSEFIEGGIEEEDIIVVKKEGGKGVFI